MNNSRTEDTTQLLEPDETKEYTRNPLKIFQKLLIILLIIAAFVGSYMSYKDELTSRWTEMFQIETDRSHMEIMANNLHEMACHLPILNPFDKSVLSCNKNPKPANCENNHTLIFTTDLESNLIQVKNYTLLGYEFCCYQKFTRIAGNDKKVKVDKNCTEIRNIKTPIPGTIDFIMVSCRKDSSVLTPGNVSNITQPEINLENSTKPPEDPEKFPLKPIDMFGFVHLKPSVEKRIFNQEKNMSKGKRKVNVVILGLDAVSHMNFMRVMPLTHDYIKKNLSAYGLSGHTKVGGNTFPNIVPAFTGMYVDEITQGCWKKKSYFDACPFIWKNFSSQGYRTVYGEDAVWMSAFNYNKKGFFNETTDYYYNALTFQLEKLLGHHNLMNAKLCYGPRIGFEVTLDYLKKMAFTMNKTRRYFQFSWTTSMTHDYLEEGKLGDQILLETLQWFKNGGYLDDTIFILMSDHGINYGGIRSTLQGRLEERMPFLYFILPEWFREKYRPAVSNLLRNEHRLTTPFDFYETLKDLLHLENIEKPHGRYHSMNDMLPRGISLFLPIPLNRTCEDAEIPEHFCVCRLKKTVEVENNSLVREATESVVASINKMFRKFPQCLTLHLNKVLNAQVFQINSSKVNDISDTIFNVTDKRLAHQEITFTIAFDVVPSMATFEATATRRTNSSWDVSGPISRTNLYGDQSICVSDYNLKKFCFCG